MKEQDLGYLAMRHVNELAGEIGPRPPGSASEARAASYVAGVLEGLGAEVSTQDFKTPRSFSYAYGLLYFLGAVSAALGFLLPPWGVLAGSLTVLLFWLEVDTRGGVYRLFSWWPSRNVIGRFRPEDEDNHQTVVLMAHHDSSRSALLFSPNRVGGFRRAFLLMWVSFLMVPLLAAVTQLGLAMDSPLLMLSRYLQSFPAVYLLGSLALLVHRELFGEDVAGANDNASGVGVMLEVLRDLPCRNLDIWAVSTGGEEAGCVGALNLIQEYGQDLRGALIINLDNVGAGYPRVAVAEGMLTSFGVEEKMVNLMREVMAELPHLGFSESVNSLMSTDAVPFLARRFRAVSLRAEDKEGLLPNWHWPTDLPENVEPPLLGAMVEFARGLLQKLDQGRI